MSLLMKFVFFDLRYLICSDFNKSEMLSKNETKNGQKLSATILEETKQSKSNLTKNDAITRTGILIF